MNRRSKIVRTVLAVAGLVAVGALVVQARLAGPGGPCSARPTAAPAPDAAPRVVAEGRLVAYPDAEVVVGTDAAGTIERLLVREKAPVRRGQVLVELKSDDLRAELAEARARIADEEAQLRLAETERERAERLVAEGVSPRQDLDRRRSERDAHVARLETARASARRLEALIGKTRIASPIDGVVVLRHADQGETVDRGAPLVTVANLDRTRVEAEVDEFDASRVAVGAEVAVTAEGHPGARWTGRVEEIPDSVVVRDLKPQDPGRPTDARVLKVKIALAEATPLKLGQRVEVAIISRADG